MLQMQIANLENPEAAKAAALAAAQARAEAQATQAAALERPADPRDRDYKFWRTQPVPQWG